MRGGEMIGPLAAWELRRLLRRGLVPRVWLLLLYAFVLVFLVFTAFWFHPTPVWGLFPAGIFRLPAPDAAAFAGNLTLVLLQAQLVAVVALTPALAASAVAEEKDRHTLPLLLTTQLTDREIVCGKAVGRITFMLAALTAAVPVLLLARVFGVVEIPLVLAGFVLTFGTVVLCAAIGLNAACQAPDFRSALLRAYERAAILACGLFIPPLVFASPFGILAIMHTRGAGAGWWLAVSCGYCAVQVGVAGLLLYRAARSLRLRDPSAGPAPASAFPLPPRLADPLVLQPERDPPPVLPPVDAANPVLWKERCATGAPAWVVPSVAKGLSVFVAVLAFTLFVGGTWVVLNRVGVIFDPARAEQLAAQPGLPDNGGALLTAAGVFAAGRYLLPLAVGLSGTIAGERFRRTLDVLLSTPLDRRAMLRAKVQAHAERGPVFAGVAVAAVGMAFTADGGIRLGVATAVLLLAGIGFVVGLGAWLTVRCATDLRTFRLVLPFALVAIAWPVGAWNLLSVEEVSRELLARGLIAVAGVCAAAGVVFWLLAERALGKGE